MVCGMEDCGEGCGDCTGTQYQRYCIRRSAITKAFAVDVIVILLTDSDQVKSLVLNNVESAIDAQRAKVGGFGDHIGLIMSL